MTEGKSNVSRVLVATLLLLVLTIAVFAEVGSHGFITLDDQPYISNNVHMQAGLTRAGVSYAFGNREWPYWVPLSIMSIMADVELFGMDAGKHHLVDLGLHAVSTLLLLLLFMRMTGSVRRSFFVAALFAVHPLHVESVAWASNRVDTLCAPFYILTLLAYVQWTRRGGVRRYAVVVAGFTLALMAKPMAVTVPVAMLLLDYWPLQRPALWSGKEGAAGGDLSPGPAWRLLREKIPFFAMSFGVAVLTVVNSSAVKINVAPVSAGARVGNAFLAYAGYLRKTAWPDRLAIFYPHSWDIEGGIPVTKAVAAAVFVVAASVAAVRLRRRAPWLFSGWFWFLLLLLPTIGLLEMNGLQGMADRYTYLPLVGIFFAVVWSAHDAIPEWGGRGRLAAALGGAVVLAFSVVSWRQVAVWKDSRTLFGHALRVTDRNYVAHGNLGVVLLQEGDIEGAIIQFREAIRIVPTFEEAHQNLGLALMKHGRVDEAIDSFRTTVGLNPDYPDALRYLGSALAVRGRVPEAISAFRAAVGKDPDSAVASYNLGVLLDGEGRVEEAIAYYRNALRVAPDYANAHNNLGNTLLRGGHRDEAIVHFRNALRLNPADEVARRNLERAVAPAQANKEAR